MADAVFEASSIACKEQQVAVSVLPLVSKSMKLSPSTSYPCSLRRYAVTEESTPPLIPTITFGIVYYNPIDKAAS